MKSENKMKKKNSSEKNVFFVHIFNSKIHISPRGKNFLKKAIRTFVQLQMTL